jgi:hypothetical protein
MEVEMEPVGVGPAFVSEDCHRCDLSCSIYIPLNRFQLKISFAKTRRSSQSKNLGELNLYYISWVVCPKAVRGFGWLTNYCKQDPMMINRCAQQQRRSSCNIDWGDKPQEVLGSKICE